MKDLVMPYLVVSPYDYMGGRACEVMGERQLSARQEKRLPYCFSYFFIIAVKNT